LNRSLTAAEVHAIAPNLNLFLWRPIIAEPPIYTFRDLKQWVTLSDVMDAHEALDLRGAQAEKASAK
jgi:hypothetical protein